MHRLFSLILMACALFITSGKLLAAAPIDTAQVDTAVEKWMADFDIPGAGLALVKDGEIVYTKGYGLRDTQTRQPATENTLFAIGSITKSFTALAVAQLADAGKIDLDAPVIQYLPDFKMSSEDSTRKLTVRQILSQSTGLPDYADDALWYSGQIKTVKEAVDHIAAMKTVAEPGKEYHYNNYNYALAGYLVETVGGQPWADYIRDHILVPLGMKTANFSIEEMQKATDHASPHQLDILKDMQPVSFKSAAGVAPAGAINASAVEMAQYLQFQMGDGTLNGKRIVSQKLLTALHTQQIQMPAAPVHDPNVQYTLGYGLGWVTGKFFDQPLVWHNGGIQGFGAMLSMLPDQNVGVVILANVDMNTANPFFTISSLGLLQQLSGLGKSTNVADEFSAQIAPQIAERQAKIKAARAYQADSKTFEPLVGDFTSIGLGTISIELRDGKFYIQVPSQGLKDLELLPIGNDEFIANLLSADGTLIDLTFKSEANGTMALYQNGSQIAQRLGKNAQPTTYTDPQNRFTVDLPANAVPVTKGDMVLIQREQPQGTFVLGANGVNDKELKTSALKFVQGMDAQFNQEPVDVREVPIPNGPTWTQFLYTLPDGTVRAILVTRAGQTDYFVGLQAKQSDIQTLVPDLNTLLLTFKITR